MYTQEINKIKSKMAEALLPAQLAKLEEVLREVLLERESRRNPAKDGKDLVRRFISAKKIEGCSRRTEEYYLSTLSYFEKSVKCDVRDADTDRIREYLSGYQKINDCSNVTLDTIRRILSSFYRWLEEEDFILKSPMKRIHRIKSPVVIKPALSDEQIEVIRKTAEKNARNLAIVDLLLSSGIRVSELMKLNRSSIDLNSRTCVVFGKGAKQRETYFDVRTKIELENYLKTRRDKNRALFVTSRRKRQCLYTRLTVNSIEKMVREIGVRTEIENVHPHRFRRTMATRAIDKGMPIEQVQVLLGHTKIDTTLRYANVQQANVRYSHQKYIC